MRCFSSEFAHNYGTYSFGYCNYCEYEKGDTLHDLYLKGYLPYSGSTDTWNTFYMARSTRINLTDWTPNSENRRVLRKHENLFKRTEYGKKDFTTDAAFKEFCLSYFKRHHGVHTMPKERFEHILEEETLTHIVEYRQDDILAGYIFLAQDADMTHVWFYFYASDFAQSSFGMWFLINEATVALETKRKHFYIGTAYGDKSRYKTNFSHLEFWDGQSWQVDKDNKEVKKRIKNDHLELVDATDTFKKERTNYFT